ncbi:MAG: hypothetical protein WCT02_04505, partial [Candidatus Paceibacterota bacterium]
MSLIRVDKFNKDFLGQWYIIIDNNGDNIHAVFNAGCFSSSELRGAVVFNTLEHKDFESYYSDFRIKIIGSRYQCQQAGFFVFEKSEQISWKASEKADTLPYFDVQGIGNNNGHMTFEGLVSISGIKRKIKGMKEKG